MPRNIPFHDYITQRTTRPKLSLLSLPNDLFVDLIFSELSIQDILYLRATCKTLYALTHQPAIWKRLLVNYHIPIHPLPPSEVYSLGSLSGFEAERLLSRSIGIHANWKSKTPRIFKAWRFPMWHPISSMKIAPGGKYLFASVCTNVNKYALKLCMLDHRVKVAYPIAILDVGPKPYNLDVKYMRCRGELGLAVTYMTRSPRRRRDADVNVSEYDDGPQVDFPVPILYHLSTFHVPYSALHVMQDPRFPPGSREYWDHANQLPLPFVSVGGVVSRSRFECTDMDEIDGEPYLVYAQGNTIVVKNLHSQGISHFNCYALVPLEQSTARSYAIRAIRILPTQRELLVVRTNDKNTRHPVFLEVYRIPCDGEMRDDGSGPPPEAKARSWNSIYEHGRILQVRISAHGLPHPRDASVHATRKHHAEPPPVSVYMVVEADNFWGTRQYRLWPERVPTAGVRDLEPMLSFTEAVQLFEAEAEVTIPLTDLQNLLPDSQDGVNLEADTVTSSETGTPAPHDAMVVTGTPTPNTASGTNGTPIRASAPVPISETTFRFPVRGDNVSRIAYQLGAPERIRLHFLPGVARALVYGTDPEDRTIAPSLKGFYAYTDHFRPPAPDARWPEDGAWRAAAEAECEWADAAMAPRTQKDGALAVLPILGVRQMHPFHGGVLAMDWEDCAGKLCFTSGQEPGTVYMLEFAPGPTEEKDGHRVPLPVPDVDQEFRI
ncbi:hypothetical protein BV25DRAFT_1919333 [Artomyces pyxidatus]|uniref:Uncharacterized protein n=1 Tax=Artomyces pyxidatus TaxID=48021 RepID=A0ACB8SQI0_9AGAM|nr:hypothetical protein BV25DRAFT_1919333 [Artomyces pyxidatus]